MNISNHKKTILITIIVLLLFFGYWFLFLSKKENTTTVLSTSGLKNQSPTISNTPYDKEFVSSLIGLDSVNLDVSVFESKVYQALSYPEIPFVVNYFRETGRYNPFLPIGVDVNRTQNVQTQVNTNSSANASSTRTISEPEDVPSSTSTTTNKTPTPKTF